MYIETKILEIITRFAFTTYLVLVMGLLLLLLHNFIIQI